jgi:hypothetical protein
MEPENIKQYVFAVMPVLITAFFVISLTLICETRWLIALIQIPAWIALIWWLYMAKQMYELINDW